MQSKFKYFIKKNIGVIKIANQNNSIQIQLAELNKKSDEIYWSHVFNSTIESSTWLTNKSFSPGRWAAGYPMLYLLYRIYNDVKPLNIIEFGLGESSKLLYQYNKKFPETSYLIIEQDAEWLDFFSKSFNDIKSKTLVLDIEHKNIEGSTVYQYKNLLSQINHSKYNLIVIDGPWGSDQHSRYQIVEMALNELIEEDFIIVMDDYERLGEKTTIQKLKSVFSENNINHIEGIYSGLKETYIICSEKYKFLISL